MSIRFFAYDVPIFDEDTDQLIGNKTIVKSEQEAIEYQKSVAAQVRPEFKYNNDSEALEDFIIVNWAYEIFKE